MSHSGRPHGNNKGQQGDVHKADLKLTSSKLSDFTGTFSPFSGKKEI